MRPGSGFQQEKGARDEEVEDASESSLSGESDGDAEDVLCQVHEWESSDHDQILYCDRCNIAVHQSCYGVPEVPEVTFSASSARSERDNGIRKVEKAA